MCGIWFLLEQNETTPKDTINKCFHRIKGRGPDNSTIICLPCRTGGYVHMGFHRLAINGTSEYAHQPFVKNGVYLICNGEIYNYKSLIVKYDLHDSIQDIEGGSDCEVLLHLYFKIGFLPMIDAIDGVFAMIVYDTNKGKIFSSRDIFGVRPLFYTFSKNKFGISSEAKALVELKNKVYPIYPRSYLEYSIGEDNLYMDNWYTLYQYGNNMSDIQKNIRELFTKAVHKRLMASRRDRIGCLLSGGLDSSIVAAIAAKEIEGLRTFTIGFRGCPDIYWAEKVAKHIGSVHTTVYVTKDEVLGAIKEVIYTTESFDVTTIRASVWQYLLGRYIHENTDINVILNGDGADELMQGYIYFNDAPGHEIATEESIRLLKNIHLYDVLRVDRSLSCWGLEARVTFLDRKFAEYYMKIRNEYKWTPKMEKKLFRDSFENMDLIPYNILYRKKEAFSDGTSSSQDSWHDMLSEYFEEKVRDIEYFMFKNRYSPCVFSKESYYYRKKFEQYFKGKYKWNDRYWMPRWSKSISGSCPDPSARVLYNY